MRTLIIGYGSAGRKHFLALKKIRKISQIKILSNFNKYKKFRIKKEEVVKYNPHYIVICNHTSEHYNSLKFINENLKEKIILVEKPLFHKPQNYNLKNKNNVYVGYTLRYHPIVRFLKKFVKSRKINLVEISCNSYLPTWRSNINYSKSNSAKKKYGGGALLELSHEIDYLNFIFGKFKFKFKFKSKLSPMLTNVEDFYQIIAHSNKIKHINLKVNIFDIFKERKIKIIGNNFSILSDLIKNNVTIFNKNKIISKNFEKKNYLLEQHKDILNNKKYISSYKNGLDILKIISKIKK